MAVLLSILNKEQILAADDLPRETVAVPEWGGDVIVQCLSFAQSEAMLSAANGDSEIFAIRLLANSLVDESGKPLFTAENIIDLKAKNSKVLARLIEVCNRLNFFDEPKAEKNLSPTASETPA